MALVLGYLPMLLLIAGACIIVLTTDVPLGHLTRDVTAVANLPFYTGALSTIGIILWSATASICFITSIVLRANSKDSDAVQFLFCSGTLTSILMLDDAFELHENTFRLGVSESVLLIMYILLAVILFSKYIKFIYHSDNCILLLSILFFAASVAFDKLNDYHMMHYLHVKSHGIMYLLEDGSKLLGIVGWLSYFGWTCFVLLTKKTE